MNKIHIKSITANKLRTGKYQKILPEYYQLQSVTENNSWHVQQNVFDHVVSVFSNFEHVLELRFLDTKKRQAVTKHLNSYCGRFSRKELLTVATVLHDIAKNVTLVSSASGQTKCPGHEVIGSLMIDNFVSRFDLDADGTTQVRKIILYHGFTHDLLSLIISKSNIELYFGFLKQVAPDYWIELVLLAYADMLGSNVKKVLPEDFKKREKLIVQFLRKTT